MLTIRKLLPQDAQLWKKYRLEALKFHPENFLNSLEDEEKLNDLEWKGRLLENDIFGLFEDLKLVSMVSFSILPKNKLKHIGEIWGVYTLPSARGKGYLTELLKHVLSYAEKKVDHCILTCTTSNTGAFHVYQKLGFKVYGIDKNAIKVQDTFYDEYLMSKTFQVAVHEELVFTKNQNPTVERFFALKNNLTYNLSDIKSTFKDCIYHDLSLGTWWQTFVTYFRKLCYYVFNCGRYHDVELLLSTLSSEENIQLKNKLDTENIYDFMLKC